MKKRRVLYIGKDKSIAKGLQKEFDNHEAEIANWEHFWSQDDGRGYNIIGEHDLVIIDEEIGGTIEKGEELREELRKREIRTPIVILKDEAETEVNNSDYIINKAKLKEKIVDNQQKRKTGLGDLTDIANREFWRIPILYDIGVIGGGRFGTEFLKGLKRGFMDNVYNINVQSNHHADNPESLWNLCTLTEGDPRHFFVNLEDMFDANPNLDFLLMASGVYGQAAPKNGKATKDRSAAFKDAMSVIYPRLQKIKQAMDDGKFKGLLTIVTGPQDMILEHMTKEMGFPTDKVTGITPDPMRAESILIGKIREEYPAYADKIKGVHVPIVGWRSCPNPLYSMSEVDLELNGKGRQRVKLFDFFPKFKEVEIRQQMIQKLKEYGWGLMEDADKHGISYSDSPNEALNRLADLKNWNIQSRGIWFTYRPQLGMMMMTPAKFKRKNGIYITCDSKSAYVHAEHYDKFEGELYEYGKAQHEDHIKRAREYKPPTK